MLTFTTALIVKVIATILVALVALYSAERLGPFWGAMVAAFPTIVGPAFVILAIERSPEFLAGSALAAAAMANASIALAVAITLLAARRVHPITVVGGAWTVWLAFAVTVHLLPWTPVGVLIVFAIVFAIGKRLVRPVLETPVDLPPFRPRWYDIPMRATLAGLFVTTVTAIGGLLGSTGTGIVASFPVILSTLAIILLPRSGPAVTAATFAHTLQPMLLFPAAVIVVHITAVPLGSGLALALGFAVCLAWALILIVWKHRNRASEV